MNNFARVVRLALRYRFTFAVCRALAVAVLWGGNIGAVYPFMKVAFEGKSLQQWVDGEIDKPGNDRPSERRLETQQKESAAARPTTARAGAELATQSRLAAEQRAEWAYIRLKPYLDRYLPHDPFQTLAW